MRDTVAELLSMAGITSAPEQKLPDGQERPADLLVSSWRARTVAIDFTIITPTRASAATSSNSTTTLMDQTAAQKQQKSRTACEAAGWSFQPFVADTYGALRADARGFVARFIKRYHHKFPPLDEAQAGRAIWCTISTAVISRAAQQLCRLSLIDNPLGLPLQALDLRSARSTSSTLPFAPPRLHDMGIILQQPSQDAEAEEDLFDFPAAAAAQLSSAQLIPQAAPQPDAVMEEPNHPSTAATTGFAHEAENKLPRQTQLVFLRSTANGQSLPVYLEPGATLDDLRQLLVAAYRIDSSTYSLSYRAQPLQPGLSLAEQGVNERCEISLHPKAPP